MDSFDITELIRSIRKQISLHEIDYKFGISMIEFLEKKQAILIEKENSSIDNEQTNTQNINEADSFLDRMVESRSTKEDYQKYIEDLGKYQSYRKKGSLNLEQLRKFTEDNVELVAEQRKNVR